MKLLLQLAITLALLISIIVFFPYLSATMQYYITRSIKINYVLPSQVTEISSLDTRTRVLKLPDSPIYLAIPKIPAVAPIDLAIDTQDQPRQRESVTAGHLFALPQSPQPDEPGTVLLSAHLYSQTNYPQSNSAFYFARDLLVGDTIHLGYQGIIYTYQITAITAIDSLPDLTQDYSSYNLTLLVSSPFMMGLSTQIDATLQSPSPR